MKREASKVKTIYDAICKILKYTHEITNVEELTSNLMVWDAVKMNLVLIYETYKNIENELIRNYSTINWNEIEEYKPKLENQYIGFISDEIWNVIKTRMPEFKIEMESVL